MRESVCVCGGGGGEGGGEGISIKDRISPLGCCKCYKLTHNAVAFESTSTEVCVVLASSA